MARSCLARVSKFVYRLFIWFSHFFSDRSKQGVTDTAGTESVYTGGTAVFYNW
jgi:hypothetical protein